MALKVLSGVKLPIDRAESELLKTAEKSLKKKAAHFAIRKKSLDARDKHNLHYVYTIEFDDKPFQPKKEEIERLPKNKTPEKSVVVVGSGPAGLFCALRLLDRGIKPVVVERGPCVEERAKKIDAFVATKVLDENGNIQFGEGGAGTFSDGKLNTQTHGGYNAAVLETFVDYGAPKEILWLNKPHLGTDNLRRIVRNMREDIIARGGEVRFDTLLVDWTQKAGRISSVKTMSLRTGKEEEIETSTVVFAIGHSARDTFEKLHEKGIKISQKEFSVGLRIEHLQADISRAQYGDSYAKLPPADYKLVAHGSERASFTFCMCPGGIVVPATSERGGVVVNGMSNYARDEVNANAALIAQVKREDFDSDHPLAGIAYQRRLERNAFLAGGGDYAAPVQLVGDFLQDRESRRFGEILPSYSAGTAFADMRAVLPPAIVTALKEGLTIMDGRMKGFARYDAVLSGVESRTSSPVRIERGEDMQSVTLQGLYPCGEGAGYAGGITSAAADGMKVADAIFQSFMQNG
ncbi:MAG: FAD-binding protein [Clostridia bacterium]|nr:FAD-binding protein [Clostridia bacterium]